MKILITGSNGLLGQKLLYKLRIDDSVDLVATSKGENRVSVRDGYIGHVFLDTLSFLEKDGEWKIYNKLFHVES